MSFTLVRLETTQEKFWREEFGNNLIPRNTNLAKMREPFFSKIMALGGDISSVCELGCNIGENLLVLRLAKPEIKNCCNGNKSQAFEQLSDIEGLEGTLGAIQDYEPGKAFDLTMTVCVLIHLNPDDLPLAHEKLLTLSSKYILINEYFNPVPVAISCRGHEEKLFKRDFTGEFLEQYKGKVEVVDYRFLWKRDVPVWDNTNWALFEKRP